MPTTVFPATPTFQGHLAPSRIEADVECLEVVEGAIPPDLNGTWYKVGADHQYAPYLGDDIFINGDGLMAKFAFANGTVSLKTRYVHTHRFLAERAAGRSLFGKYRNRYTDLPEAANTGRGTANTSMIWHGGRLLALKEDSLPWDIDPDTLETRGEWDWGGKLRSKTVTAHPKIDPVSGELLFFGYEAEGDGSSPIAYCIADRDGNLVHEEWFEPPFVSLAHDFAVTETHTVFMVFPVTMDPDRLKAGGDHWMWNPGLDTLVGIMPRRGSVSELRWFRKPACYAFHIFNAFDDGDKLIIDLVQSDRCAFPFIEDVSGAAFNQMQALPKPTRWTFDLSQPGDAFNERMLTPLIGELPRIDDRRMTLPYRYGYLGTFDFNRPMTPNPNGSPNFNAVAVIDTHDGSSQSWGDRGLCFEETILATSPAKPDPEDGYLLTLAADLPNNRSELLVFAARDVPSGPIARVMLPFRMKQAIHATWVPAV